ncbi:MAG: formate dehydrogenase [Burkholderiales bacterium]|nr:formate dehydrogenase [Burkholderiales bacterium]
MSEAPKRLSRRTLFAGASTVGALAAVATVVPRVAPTADTVAAMPKPIPERGGGYSLSEHVQRYYGTTRV